MKLMLEYSRRAKKEGYGSNPKNSVDFKGSSPYMEPSKFTNHEKVRVMKVRSSLKSLKNRHRDCQVVRRKGRLYVINKTDPRFKARQG